MQTSFYHAPGLAIQSATHVKFAQICDHVSIDVAHHMLKSATHHKSQSHTQKLHIDGNQRTNEGNKSNREHNKSRKHTVKDNRQMTTNSEWKDKPHKDRNEGSTNNRQPNGIKHRRKWSMEHKHKHSHPRQHR